MSRRVSYSTTTANTSSGEPLNTVTGYLHFTAPGLNDEVEAVAEVIGVVADPSATPPVEAVAAVAAVAGREVAIVQKKNVNGGWDDCWSDGERQMITNKNTSVMVYGAGIYRVNKLATADSVAIELSTLVDP